MELQKQQRNLGQVIAKAWSDPVFKERLKAHPKVVLAEMGVETPEDVAIEVKENSAEKMYLTLPMPPSQDDLSDQDILVVGSPGARPYGLHNTPNQSCASSMPHC